MGNEFILESEEKIKESIKEQLSTLPIEYQQAISAFGWLKKCQIIGEKANLTEVEIHNLKIEVALLLLGLSDMDSLHKFLENEIGGTEFERIEDLVAINVLEPVGYVFEKINCNEIVFPTVLYFDNIYSFDLPSLLEQSILYGKRAILDGQILVNQYECSLNPTFLNAFDTLRIEFVGDVKEIKVDSEGRSIGLIFYKKDKKLYENQVAFAIESIVESCKVDGELDGAFSEYEAKEFIKGKKDFLLFDHPNGHDIGIHRNDKDGITVDINVTYEEFLRFKENIN